MGYCVMDIEGQDNELIVSKQKIDVFKEKWENIINLFEGIFFTEKNGKLYLFTGQDILINSRNFSTRDDGKVNKDRAFARFFSQIIKSEGDCDFGFGQEGFEGDFYTDLLNLCGPIEWCVLSVECGDFCYYDGSFELTDGGLNESFTYNEDEDD